MKINWGTGIFIAFVAFISFILFFVIRATTHKDYAYDMVEEEYYKTEIKYQEEINKLENTKNLSSNIIISNHQRSIDIIFPKEIKDSLVNGEVYFYRPSQKSLDFKVPLRLNNGQTSISKKDILDGKWNIIISFNQGNTEYIYKQNIIL